MVDDLLRRETKDMFLNHDKEATVNGARYGAIFHVTKASGHSQKQEMHF